MRLTNYAKTKIEKDPQMIEMLRCDQKIRIGDKLFWTHGSGELYCLLKDEEIAGVINGVKVAEIDYETGKITRI